MDRRRHAGLSNPWLRHAQYIADQMARARGWTSEVRDEVDLALTIVLSGHVNGDRVRHSELLHVGRCYGLGVSPAIEVLAEVGVFADDRTPIADTWLARTLAALPGVRGGMGSWVRGLRGLGLGAGNPETVTGYLNSIIPVLRGSPRRGSGAGPRAS